MKKIEDFGEKIGGSRKDMWALFHSLSVQGQNEMAKKDILWKKPDYRKLMDNGIPKEVLFWRNEMRKAVSQTPTGDVEKFVGLALEMKEAAEKCMSVEDIQTFYREDIYKFLKKTGYRSWTFAMPDFRKNLDGNKVLEYLGMDAEKLQKACGKSGFLETREDKEDRKYLTLKVPVPKFQVTPKGDGFWCSCSMGMWSYSFLNKEDPREGLKGAETAYVVTYGNRTRNGQKIEERLGIFSSEEEANAAIAAHKAAKAAEKAVPTKKTFLPPHLSNIERTGSDYRFFRMTDGGVLLTRYGLRGGEFGNYTGSKDRLASVNMAYDAFEDLYKALGISPKDISLGGDLGIAFGARGRGDALAHYEPLMNVINITKLRGAGSLAHEWGHAMDMYLGGVYSTGGFLSEGVSTPGVPQAARDLIRSFKVKPDGEQTDFWEGSKHFDSAYKKSGLGYWTSTREMFARAFACYVKDKLEQAGRRSDYLAGHADCAKDGKSSAVPCGDERKAINANFDRLFAELLEQEVFSAEKKAKAKPEEKETAREAVFFVGTGGQMMFC